ncbi:hypothetical protein [Flavisolibacter ginsenosidimutans]|uniref:Uncharacterized protein n=1 Tax=Flavisolibacter ginsenosidimutans TaxID=661481 RepID=A0A5B8UL07_9BACT|nr:hypothetical protein [Flavisolibacter ginsenosidimutans]QEC56710.1 hypothetical protein FSB75_12650 [Flavisolibacter ginsenosidimutans]
MKKKLATLTIEVPYKRAGNVISQHPVTFDLYQDGETYILMPQLHGPELAVANLPTELCFVIENEKPLSLRGIKDGNLHVIQDALGKLKEEGLLLGCKKGEH